MDIISFNEASTANSRIEIINANPDSTSGVVTFPKVIASGETITIPTGRVAILPNVQVDGILALESGADVFVPAGSTFGDIGTRLDGLDATVATKANTSDMTTALGLKANTADLKEIGVGQTWQDMTASRVAGTTYTNTSGKPICIIPSVRASNYTNYARFDFYINGINVLLQASNEGVTYATIGGQFIVPNLATYRFDVNSGVLYSWFELR